MVILIPNFGAYPTSVACKQITDKIYYVDVDDTFTMDVNKLPSDVKNGIIIPVHLFGNNCNMGKIMKYAEDNNHIVIEDCAQSTGSGSGCDGYYSVFSFYPTKPLSSMGDGGMILTDNKDDMEYFKKLRFYGQSDRKVTVKDGINSRMDEIQCGIVNIKLDKFQKLNNVRISIAKRYNNIVKGMNENKYGIGFSRDPKCVYHQYPLLFNDRKSIIKELEKRDIPYSIHYPHHVTDMDIMKCGLNDEVGYRINDKILSLPIHPFLKEIEIQQIEEFLEGFR
jgi:dTDP-4-amino-4,6-dideoxygalactose transaminase